jgi:hypothetical protein
VNGGVEVRQVQPDYFKFVDSEYGFTIRADEPSLWQRLRHRFLPSLEAAECREIAERAGAVVVEPWKPK